MLSLSTNTRNSRKGGRKEKNISRPPRVNAAPFFRNEGDVVFKRLTNILTLGTDNLGFIQMETVSASDVNGATEFTSFVSRYTEYRVRALRIRGQAIIPVNLSNSTHGTIARGDFALTNVPISSSAKNLWSLESSRVCVTNKSFVDTLTWDMNPNAKLWTSSSTSVPATQDYGWAVRSYEGDAIIGSTLYYHLYIEWDVEFRGSR